MGAGEGAALLFRREQSDFLYNGMDYQLMKRGFDTVAFEKGMTAGLVSCGVWEALNEKEMVSYLMKKEHPYDKAQHMIAGVREK